MKRLIIIIIYLQANFLFSQISLNKISTYRTGIFDNGAAEIVDYDSIGRKLFFTNSSNNSVGILDISNTALPFLTQTISLVPYGNGVNSLSIHDTIVAIAVEGTTPQDTGKIVFFSTNGNYLNQVKVGFLPDMVTFNKNGTKVIVANEGEPDLINPKGSISIIDLSSSVNLVNQTHVKTLDFSRFNNSLPPNVRNFPGVPFDEDVEPEYITVSSDNNRAFITLQENNSIAVVDLSLDTIISIQGLGYINHNSSGFGFDASDRDSRVNISNYPVFGMFMPDAIASFDIFGTTYLFTANEGDDRGETQRVKNLSLDPTFFPNGTFLKQDSVLGRLNVSTIEGDFDNDSDYDSLFSYGTRSFSIWNANTATLIYDSGDDFESIIASNNPIYFNSDNNDNTSFDSRSDNKGPEPEAIEIAEINGAIFAFIGLERMGGIMVYNVTNPSQPIFIDYYNNRNFNVVETDTAVGDLGVECIRFISSTASPDGKSYVITANEVSGSISIFEVINLTTNVNMVEKNNLSLQIFPNPVNDHLFVKLNNGEFFDDLKIIIFDQMGRTLTRETIHSFQNNQYEVDFSSYGKGMYTVHFVVNNESYSFTVIK